MAVIQNMSTEAGDIVPSVTLSNAAQSSSFAMQTDFSSYRIKVDVSGSWLTLSGTDQVDLSPRFQRIIENFVK